MTTEGRLVILAGGVSSRMRRAATLEVDPALLREADMKPKSMIGLGENSRPLMDYLLHNARAEGYRDVVIVIGEKDLSIRNHYGAHDRGNDFHGLKISYAVQKIPGGRTKPLGTADALLQGLLVRPDWAGKKFTVCNSDNLYSRRALRLISGCEAACSMIDYDRRALEFEAARIEQFAVVSKDAHGFLLGIIEKPTPEDIARVAERDGRLGVSMNIFGFLYDRILPCLEEAPMNPLRLEKELPTAVMLLLDKYPRSLLTIPLAEHVPDLTSRNDLEGMRAYLAREFPDFSWE